MGVSLERLFLVNSIFQKNVTGTPEITPVYAVFSPVLPAGSRGFQLPLVLLASIHNYSLCFRSFHTPLFNSTHSFHFGTHWSATAKLSASRCKPRHPIRPNRSPSQSTLQFPFPQEPLCPRAKTPGTSSANSPNPKASANTCSPSKPAFALTPESKAPTRTPGALPRFSTTSTTSAGPTPTIPPTANIRPKAPKSFASVATPTKSSAPYSLMRTTATSHANRRSNTPSSPAMNSPASSSPAPWCAPQKASSISKPTP